MEAIKNTIGLILGVAGTVFMKFSVVVGIIFTAVGLSDGLSAWTLVGYFFGYTALSFVFGLVLFVICMVIMGASTTKELKDKLKSL